MARDDGSAILILGNILGNQMIPNLPDDQSLHGVSECKPIRAFNEVHRCPALELLAMRSQDFTRSRCIRYGIVCSNFNSPDLSLKTSAESA